MFAITITCCVLLTFFNHYNMLRVTQLLPFLCVSCTLSFVLSLALFLSLSLSVSVSLSLSLSLSLSHAGLDELARRVRTGLRAPGSNHEQSWFFLARHGRELIVVGVK